MTKFFTPRNLAWMSTALVVLTSLQSCYKEDAQELYQRQYVTSVALADLQDQANIFNKQIGDLQLAINNLRDREPISKLIYETTGTDTTGAFMTLGNTTIYIPFGRNGRDGKDGQDGKDGVTPAFDVTIGADGNWYINGRNTGRRAQGERGIVGEKGEDGKDGKDGRDGKDACTPTFSAAQDKDNATDTHFYWTVTWCDGRTEFIMANGEKVQAQARDGRDGVDGKDGRDGKDGETGPQGPKGEDGRPGVISPITQISYNAQGDSVIIRTTYPNMPKISIPLHPDRMFDIQPEKSREGVTEQGDKFVPTDNKLVFAPGQTLAFPYTKSAELEKVFINSLPDGWRYQIDGDSIRLTAPSLQKVEDAPALNQLTFTARDKNGQAYQRDLAVEVPKQFYINYFFNASNRVYTQQPNSPQNQLTLTNQNYQHEFAMYQLMDDGTYQRQQMFKDSDHGITGANLAAYLRQPYVYGIPKSDAMDYQTFKFQDFLYEQSRLTTAFAAETRNEDSYVLRMTNFPTEQTARAYYIEAIPWNTYGAETVIGPGSGVVKENKDRSVLTTVRLQRLAQRTILNMRNPHQWLGIPAGETIDPSRMSASIASAVGAFANGTPWISRLNNRAIVAKITGAGISYDAANDLLVVNFCHFPTQNSNSYRLLLEYTTASGTQIRKVITYGIRNSNGTRVLPQMTLAGAGGVTIFRIGVPYVDNNNRYDHSIQTIPANSNGMVRPIVPGTNGSLFEVATDDDF